MSLMEQICQVQRPGTEYSIQKPGTNYSLHTNCQREKIIYYLMFSLVIEGHWLHRFTINRFLITGLAREITRIYERLNIENVNVTAVNKAAFKGIRMAEVRMRR